MTIDWRPPPDTRDIATCKRCGRTIRLVHIESGKRVACDPDSCESGRLAAVFEASSGVWVHGRFLAHDSLANAAEARFAPHSDSCGKPRSRTPDRPARIAQIRAEAAKGIA